MDLDIVSWFLFLFGTIVGVMAFIKGYFADDPYTQYGALVRKQQAARYAYQKKERNS